MKLDEAEKLSENFFYVLHACIHQFNKYEETRDLARKLRAISDALDEDDVCDVLVDYAGGW